MNINSIKAINTTPKNFKQNDNGRERTVFLTQKDFDLLTYDRAHLLDVSKNTMKTLALLPVIDTFVAGFTKSGNLASKTKAAYIASGYWALAGLVAVSYNIVRSSIKKNSLLIRNFRENHPTTSSLIDFVAIIGSYKVTCDLAQKGITKIKDKYPTFVQKHEQKITNTLNNSRLNRGLVEKYENYLAKNPNNAKAIKLSAKMIVPVIFLASTLRFISESQKYNKYEKLMHSLDALNYDNHTKV